MATDCGLRQKRQKSGLARESLVWLADTCYDITFSVSLNVPRSKYGNTKDLVSSSNIITMVINEGAHIIVHTELGVTSKAAFRVTQFSSHDLSVCVPGDDDHETACRRQCSGGSDFGPRRG